MLDRVKGCSRPLTDIWERGAIPGPKESPCAGNRQAITLIVRLILLQLPPDGLTQNKFWESAMSSKL